MYAVTAVLMIMHSIFGYAVGLTTNQAGCYARALVQLVVSHHQLHHMRMHLMTLPALQHLVHSCN